MRLVQVFPLLVGALEAVAGVVYVWSWWRTGNSGHGWLAVTWLAYSLACVGLAKAS